MLHSAHSGALFIWVQVKTGRIIKVISSGVRGNGDYCNDRYRFPFLIPIWAIMKEDSIGCWRLLLSICLKNLFAIEAHKGMVLVSV